MQVLQPLRGELSADLSEGEYSSDAKAQKLVERRTSVRIPA